MSSFISLDPNNITQLDSYKLLVGSVLPRPIAFVSTQSPDGILNLAPFSFFNAVCSKPPTILFCPAIRGSDGHKKDTLLNIEATREFVVNIVSEDIACQMNETAAEVAPDISEFELSGLTPTPSLIVKPPRVLESPISMECKLQQIIHIGDGSVGSGSVVLGTVVQFHVLEDIYHGGRIDTLKLKPVGRLAGSAYCAVKEIFELQRPGTVGKH